MNKPTSFRRADEEESEQLNDSIPIRDEYDVGEESIGSIELIEVEDTHDPLVDETDQSKNLEEECQIGAVGPLASIEIEHGHDPLADETEQPEYLEEEYQDEFKDVIDKPFNMGPIRASLDNSDCVVTAAYFLETQTDDDEETETEK